VTKATHRTSIHMPAGITGDLREDCRFDSMVAIMLRPPGPEDKAGT
jgi:hypothetical protein